MTDETRQLRVLHCIGALGAAGSEYQLLQIVRGNDASRFHHEVACLYPPLDLKEPLEAAGATVHVLGGHGGLSDHKAARQVARLLREGQFDLQHGHVKGCYFGRFGALLAGVPPIIHEQNPITIKPRHYLLVDRLLLPWTAAVLCVSRQIARDTVTLLGNPTPKAHVFPNTVMTERLERTQESREAFRGRLGVGGEQRLIVMVGRLAEQKCHRLAVEAMPEILRHHPGTKLAIAGDGPLRADLEVQIRDLDLQESVTLLGAVDCIGDVLRAGDVFLLSSIFEGQALALMEAMWAGLPVVCSRVAGADEAIADGENGLLFAKGDAQGCADAVSRILNDEEFARELAGRGRQYAREHATIEGYCKRLEALYEEVARASPRRLPA